MDLAAAGPVAILTVALVALLAIDLRLFARDREPGLREATVWSIGWFVLSLLAAIPLLLLDGRAEAVAYTTVYLIERSLSLDNLFVFLLLFAYFGVPVALRARLLFWGIIGAIALRGLAILGGVALIERYHWIVYPLGVALLVLAWRMLRGVEGEVHPDRNLMVRAVRRIWPVTPEFHGRRWFVVKEGRRQATPLFLCLAAMIFADIAFAVDSIPAAFAITLDPFIIWMGNVFALLGLRALFVLVEGLIRRFRYLNEAIAVALALVAAKLLTEDLVTISAELSLALIALVFATGIAASLLRDRRDAERAVGAQAK